MRNPKPHFAPLIFNLVFWAVATTVVANCGSNGENAAGCAEGGIYVLGCIGDGRRDTTPGDQPVGSCAKDAYTYFAVRMSFPSPQWTASSRDQIERCDLRIVDASGNPLISYVLPSGVTADGRYYGCVPGQTSRDLGELSYSSCCAKGSSLQFVFNAMAGGDAIGSATATGTCTQGRLPTGEILVELEADHF